MKIIHSLGFYFHCTVLENKTSKWCMITNYRQFLTFTFSTLMYIFTVTTVTSLSFPFIVNLSLLENNSRY